MVAEKEGWVGAGAGAGEGGSLSVDAALQSVGPLGRYTLLHLALLLPPILLASLYECGYIFEAQQQNYRCLVEECESPGVQALVFEKAEWESWALPASEPCHQFTPIYRNGSCSSDNFNANITQPCRQFVYERPGSLIQDFGLECAEWKRALVGTVHNAGMFIALLLTGAISDRWGRRIGVCVSCVGALVCGVARAFARSFPLYLSLHFLEAASAGGLYTSTFVFAVELVGAKQRVLVSSVLNSVFVLGLVTLAGTAWTVDSWRHLVLAMYSPAALVAGYVLLLRESARWLVARGRHEDAVHVLATAARMNGVDERNLRLQDLAAPLLTIPSNNDSKPTKPHSTTTELKKIFTSVMIWKRLITCSFLWVTCTLVYYGMSINSVSLAGNRYLNFILVVLAELPANLIVVLVLDRFGRKKIIIITFVISGIMCLLFAFLTTEGWWALALYLSGKCAVTVAYSAVYIYVSEVFPTSARQTLLAACSTCGRIGTLAAPLTPLLGATWPPLPLALFGAMCLAACGLVVLPLLPETAHAHLPDTMADAERLAAAAASPDNREESG